MDLILEIRYVEILKWTNFGWVKVITIHFHAAGSKIPQRFETYEFEAMHPNIPAASLQLSMQELLGMVFQYQSSKGFHSIYITYNSSTSLTLLARMTQKQPTITNTNNTNTHSLSG